MKLMYVNSFATCFVCYLHFVMSDPQDLLATWQYGSSKNYEDLIPSQIQQDDRICSKK